jgi:hypothetical protein
MLEVQITINGTLNYITKGIIECIAFWNHEGLKVYNENRA